MKVKMILWVLIGLFLTFSNAKAEVQTAEPAPDFQLTDIHGKTHHLSDYRGSFVVLEWTNPDCPFVKKHYNSGNMQNLQKEYGNQGVVWLSMASSAPGKQGHYSPEEWGKLTQEKGAMPKAVLLDPAGKVGKLYGAQTTPHMFIINPEGELIYQGAIDNTPSADPADIPASKNYVRQALDSAMAGEAVEIPATKSYGCSVKY